MLRVRVIARLDVKGQNVIKGVQFEGLRVVGQPHDLAVKYYEQGADEILFVDAVASLYGRSNLFHVVSDTARDVFVPLTAGGGIRSVADVRRLMESGADKVAVNTAAVETPGLIREIARSYGSQAVCLSIQAKRRDGSWIVMTNCGRETSGRDVLDWIKEGQDLGAGEILLTSVDADGTFSGPDEALIRKAAEIASVPLVASGGLGKALDGVSMLQAGADAVCLASALHYDRTTITEVKTALASAGYPVRRV